MSKYTFEIYETWKIEESFEADTLEEAYEIASEMYYNEEVVLDSSDFADVNIEVIGETE